MRYKSYSASCEYRAGESRHFSKTKSRKKLHFLVGEIEEALEASYHQKRRSPSSLSAGTGTKS